MDFTNETLWEYIIKAFEWLGSALLAVAVFIFKGYRDEFLELKKDNKEIKEALSLQDKNYVVLLEKLTHMNNNIRNWQSGNINMIKDIDTIEKSVAIMQTEIAYIKQKV